MFTAPAAGVVTIDTSGSNYDTLVSVYRGSCGSFQVEAGPCNDDAGGGLQSDIAFPVTGDTTYTILVTAPAGSAGTLVFHLLFEDTASAGLPANDTCTGATGLSGTGPFTDTITTSAATAEFNELQPTCVQGAPGTPGRSVWYRFTAATDGIVTADTFGSGYDTVLSVFTGSCANPGILTGLCNDNAAAGVQSQVYFAASAGTTYFFQVMGAGNAGGALVFNLSLEEPWWGAGLPPDPALVAPPVDLTVATSTYDATSFLYTGPEPIQVGMAPDTIDARRAAVVRGLVQQIDDPLDGTFVPLSGVRVTIVDHPEYGTTVSRADGMFDLAVNGVGPLTVRYEKTGYIAVERQVQVPARDFVSTPDVVLIPYDGAGTFVDLTILTDDAAVVRSSVSEDTDGARQATLVVQAETSATRVLSDGTPQSLGEVTIRATELTVGDAGPKAMPAELPPTSFYTYAVHLEALEAAGDTVTFSTPLAFYVENFLGFPVGETVPSGYYDRNASPPAWMPSENGVVIKIVSKVEVGGVLYAELDTDTTPGIDNGVAIGVTDAERKKLAALYEEEQTLWRVPISHFSTYDLNWGFEPPGGATGPDGSDPYQDQNEDDPCPTSGSVLECQNQTVGKQFSLASSGQMHYRSNRTAGRKAAYTVHIPLSGPSVPASVKRIELGVSVAGRETWQTFPAGSNQKTSFTWDGQDAYGRRLQGSTPMIVRIGFVYNAVYTQTGRFGYSGNGIPITGDRARREVTLWRATGIPVGPWNARGMRLGGWSFGWMHSYDPRARVLYRGDGKQRSAAELNEVIDTVAGSLESGYSGDGGPATEAKMEHPEGVAFAPDGSLYIAALHNNCVRKVDPQGIINTVAGQCQQPAPSFNPTYGDGGPATQAKMGGPFRVAVGPDGSVYIVDADYDIIRRVTPDGIINTVAGMPGWEGYYMLDNVPATSAALHNPRGLSVASDGTLYIADSENHAIRRVGPDGIITTVAGIPCLPGYNGDGIQATTARLNGPWGVAAGPNGSFYIADTGNGRIRRVTPDGIIITVYQGPSGSWPYDVTVGNDGSFCVALHYDNKVQCFGPDGTPGRVLGTGEFGSLGDGGPAAAAQLREPEAVSLAPDGTLYIANADRVRRVQPPLPAFNAKDLLVTSGDGSEVYEFDPNGRHLRTFHALTGGLLRQFHYDPEDGLLAQIKDVKQLNADGSVAASDMTTMEWDEETGHLTAIIGPDGQRTEFTMDANGYLASVTDPAGDTTTYVHTSDGLLTSSTDAKGNTSTYSFDSDGRLQQANDPAGGAKTFTRDSGGGWSAIELTTAVTETESRTTEYRTEHLPDGLERRTVQVPSGLTSVSETGPDEVSVSTARDGTVTTVTRGPDPRFGMQAPITAKVTVETPLGHQSVTTASRSVTLEDRSDPLSLLSQTDAVSINGRPFVTTFAAGAPDTITVTTPELRQSVTSVDRLGRAVRNEAGGSYLYPTERQYDSRGRLSSVIQGPGPQSPLSRVATFEYYASEPGDPNSGLLRKSVDAAGQETVFVYDAGGRVREQRLPDNRVIAYTYDANGNLTAITPPARPAHTFDYTPLDFEEEYVAPETSQGVPPLANRTTSYAYTLARELRTITRPDGQVVDFDYDGDGRVETVTLPAPLAPGNEVRTYMYNPNSGVLSSITVPDAVLSFSQDGFLQTSEAWQGNELETATVTRSYDNDFRVTALQVNTETPITFGYDNDGLLTQAGELTLTWHPDFPFVTGTYWAGDPNGLIDSREATAFGEVGRYTARNFGSDLLDIQYPVRDNLGRIVEMVESVEGGAAVTRKYVYDDAGRLHQVKDAADQVIAQYEYDSNGNRTGGFTAAGSILSTDYDDQDRLLDYTTTAGATTYTYTANGELASKTVGTDTTTYVYDALGNLRRVTLHDGQPSEQVIDYLVDGRNRRVGKKVDGGLVKQWLYRDQLNPIAELDGSGELVAQFVYASKPNLPDYFVKYGADAGTYRIISDHLGSPRLVVDVSDGSVVQRMDFDEFGNVITDTNPGFQPFGFAGGIYDADTKLVRFGARDYSAETGRWTAKDPIRFGGGESNLYGYVLSDPINAIDPSGLYGTNSCEYYERRCAESGGTYYCSTAPFFCEAFPQPEDPDPTTDDDREGFLRCTRQCLQDCDAIFSVGQDSCPAQADQRTDSFDDEQNTFCHVVCYSGCGVFGTVL
jgi:RHS repeat-associated protein